MSPFVICTSLPVARLYCRLTPCRWNLFFGVSNFLSDGAVTSAGFPDRESFGSVCYLPKSQRLIGINKYFYLDGVRRGPELSAVGYCHRDNCGEALGGRPAMIFQPPVCFDRCLGELLRQAVDGCGGESVPRQEAGGHAEEMRVISPHPYTYRKWAVQCQVDYSHGSLLVYDKSG